MRLQTRLYSALTATLLGMSAAPPVYAAAGLSVSVENLYAPLGKQVEAFNDEGVAEVLPGRETTEWLGVSGFYDLNRNWRLLYGAHATLLERPLFKLDGSLAFMLDMADKVPLQPYFFLGATPVIAPGSPTLPPLGMSLHAGTGVDYSWNNQLYTSLRLNTYLLSVYGEEENRRLNLQWLPFSFSFSVGMGYLF